MKVLVQIFSVSELFQFKTMVWKYEWESLDCSASSAGLKYKGINKLWPYPCLSPQLLYLEYNNTWFWVSLAQQLNQTCPWILSVFVCQMIRGLRLQDNVKFAESHAVDCLLHAGPITVLVFVSMVFPSAPANQYRQSFCLSMVHQLPQFVIWNCEHYTGSVELKKLNFFISNIYTCF